MRRMIIAVVLVLSACSSRPHRPPAADVPREAIDIKYVGVSSTNVYAEPTNLAAVITTYGYTETVPILARQGDWVEVRTGDATGWVREAELIGAAEVEPILKNPAPRFVTAPAPVPDPRARGEVVIEAKVNTDGDVVAVQIVKNTTGRQDLADANVAALKQARFYPMVQKGQRMSFTYGYGVTY